MKAPGEAERDIKEIIDAARGGDRDAFEVLYTTYFNPVFRYIYLRVRDKAEVELLTQDVFIKVYKNLSYFEPKSSSPLPYFFTIARNTIIDYWRKNRDKVVYGKDDIMLQVPDEEAKTDDLAHARELRTLLYSGLNMLSAEERDAITMRYLQDVSYKDIAKTIGKSEDAVRQLVSRGLKKLRDVLAELNA